MSFMISLRKHVESTYLARYGSPGDGWRIFFFIYFVATVGLVGGVCVIGWITYRRTMVWLDAGGGGLSVAALGLSAAFGIVLGILAIKARTWMFELADERSYRGTLPNWIGIPVRSLMIAADILCGWVGTGIVAFSATWLLRTAIRLF